MNIAYLILAHNYPKQLNRLIKVLSSRGAYFFVHIDQKSNIAEFEKIIPENENIFFLKDNQRIMVYWGGFSVVKAILNLLQSAMNSKICFSRYCILSGTDFPIKSNDYIKKQFNSEKEFIRIDRRLSTLDKNTHICNVRHYYFNDSPFLRKIKLLQKIPRKIYKKITLYQGSGWWALTNSCIEYILKFIKKNPDYINFHKHVHVTDEIFFHSIIKNSHFATKITHDFEKAISPNVFLGSNEHGCHYIDWQTKGVHLPKILDMNDIEALISTRALFARKFDEERSKELLQEIEEKCLKIVSK